MVIQHACEIEHAQTTTKYSILRMWKYNMILPSTARPEQNEPGHQATYNLRRPISHGKPRTMLRKQLDCPQAVFGLGGAWTLTASLEKSSANTLGTGQWSLTA